jgi:hypothetical protein
MKKRFVSVQFIGGLPHGGDMSLGSLQNQGDMGWLLTPGDTFGDPYEVLARIGNAFAKQEVKSPVSLDLGDSIFDVVLRHQDFVAQFAVTANDKEVCNLLKTTGLTAEQEAASREFLKTLPGIIAAVLS